MVIHIFLLKLKKVETQRYIFCRILVLNVFSYSVLISIPHINSNLDMKIDLYR